MCRRWRNHRKTPREVCCPSAVRSSTKDLSGHRLEDNRKCPTCRQLWGPSGEEFRRPNTSENTTSSNPRKCDQRRGHRSAFWTHPKRQDPLVWCTTTSSDLGVMSESRNTAAAPARLRRRTFEVSKKTGLFHDVSKDRRELARKDLTALPKRNGLTEATTKESTRNAFLDRRDLDC